MSSCGAKLTKVGIYGYGRFGSFLAKEMSRSFDVIVTDINMTNIDQKQESITYLLENEFFLTDFDIVVFANSINSFECVIEKIGKINPSFWTGKLITDVLSVKEFVLDVMNVSLPPNTEIILTHPMFGPDSVHGVKKLVYYPINIINVNRVNVFLDFWRSIGCDLIHMSPEEHDKQASRSQLITHLIGRILNELQLQPSNIDTFSFQSLLKIINVTCSDSKELFLGLARKNKNTRKMIDDLKLALSKIESEIFNY